MVIVIYDGDGDGDTDVLTCHDTIMYSVCMSGDLISSQHLSTREVETSLRSVEEREIVYCYHVVAGEGGLDTSTLAGGVTWYIVQ